MTKEPELEALEEAYTYTRRWLGNINEAKVGAVASVEALRASFDMPLPESGADPVKIITDLAKAAESGLNINSSGRFFAWVNGGCLASALAADLLVTAWDQNASMFAVSPAASIIEEVAGNWMKDLLDLPREASFAFTTGCQMAHTTALAAARLSVLEQAGWALNEQGMFGAPKIHLITSGNRHGSIERAARFLGFGQNSHITVKTDEMGRMQAGDLRAVLSQAKGPKIVCLNAADLNVGAFDEFDELIPVAKEFGAWVHVDGAFGLYARASRAKRHLLAGVELADSWATDGHKWLNVPYDCGIAIIRDSKAHRAAMTLSAEYIATENIARDQIDWNMEWSRRARAIPVYASLKELGRSGVEDMIDRCCTYCEAIVNGIGALAGVRVLAAPTLNQGLIRFERPGASDEENNQYTLNMIEQINKTGEAFFSSTLWRGTRAMRVSVVNWRTNEEDVSRTIAVVQKVLQQSHV